MLSKGVHRIANRRVANAIPLRSHLSVKDICKVMVLDNSPVFYNVITNHGFLPEAKSSFYYMNHMQDHLTLTVKAKYRIRKTRAVISDLENDGTADLITESHYYPFGMTFMNYTSDQAGADNNYLFNGKELQSDLGLDWYDYGARMYDASLGRWFVVDEMAEISSKWSPYVYTFDNPLIYTDPDGRWGRKIHHDIIDRAFASRVESGQMSKKEVRQLKTGSDRADNPLLGNQNNNRSYIHSMKADGQSSADAKDAKGKFVADKTEEFIKGGDVVSLGMAMHSIMDENSPTHGEKQADGSYEPKELGKLSEHLEDEKPNNIDKDEFECLMDEAVEKVTEAYDAAKEKQQQQQQQEEEKKKEVINEKYNYWNFFCIRYTKLYLLHNQG